MHRLLTVCPRARSGWDCTPVQDWVPSRYPSAEEQAMRAACIPKGDSSGKNEPPSARCNHIDRRWVKGGGSPPPPRRIPCLQFPQQAGETPRLRGAPFSAKLKESKKVAATESEWWGTAGGCCGHREALGALGLQAASGITAGLLSCTFTFYMPLCTFAVFHHRDVSRHDSPGCEPCPPKLRLGLTHAAQRCARTPR